MARDAHFLHSRPVLEALVSPNVDQPRALTWVGREETLLIASRSGALTLFEPAFGIREVGEGPEDPIRIALDRGLVAIVDGSGRLEVRDWPDLHFRWKCATDFVGGLQVVIWARGIAIIGEDGDARRVLVFDDAGRVRARARVPPRTALGVDTEGNLLLARSTQSGTSVEPFGRPLAPGDSTEHHLRLMPTLALVGVASGGVTVWNQPGAPPVNVKAFEVSQATLAPGGVHLAFGTRIGRIAFTELDVGSNVRNNPARVEGHDSPVLSVEFCRRGRWLATAAERCWVWAY